MTKVQQAPSKDQEKKEQIQTDQIGKYSNQSNVGQSNAAKNARDRDDGRGKVGNNVHKDEPTAQGRTDDMNDDDESDEEENGNL